MFVAHNKRRKMHVGGVATGMNAHFVLAVLWTPFLCSGEMISFDQATAGTVPAGWTVAMTHTGGAPKWEIRVDDSAPSKPNVLAQVSTDRTAGRFPLAIWDRASIKDGAVSVKFKAMAGAVDQGAGLVWRYRDANNYYIVRANALEENVVLYKVQNGERVSLAPKGAVLSSLLRPGPLRSSELAHLETNILHHPADSC